MDNPKSRGLKHVKNKKKYKPSSKVIPVAQKQAIRKSLAPALESNWDRYDPVDETTHLNGRTDFALLANAPISSGSHFQFKTDKNIAHEIKSETMKNDHIFNLDLNLLGLSIASIPFDKRSGIPSDVFTESHKFKIKGTTSDNSAKYDKYLIDNKINRINIEYEPNFESDESEESESDGKKASSNKTQLDPEEIRSDSEIDQLSKDSTNSEQKEKNTETDLEKWLEDILDD